jgi:transposase
MGRTGVALEPLWRCLAELLRQVAVLHADETPVPQPDPDRRKTNRAYLWAYRSNALGRAQTRLVSTGHPKHHTKT